MRPDIGPVTVGRWVWAASTGCAVGLGAHTIDECICDNGSGCLFARSEVRMVSDRRYRLADRMHVVVVWEQRMAGFGTARLAHPLSTAPRQPTPPTAASRPHRRGVGVAPYLLNPATRLMVIAMITAPKTNEIRACRRTLVRMLALPMSVSDTWKVIPTVKAR